MKDSTAIVIALIGIVVPATGAYLAFYDKRHPISEPPLVANPTQNVASAHGERSDTPPATNSEVPAQSNMNDGPPAKIEEPPSPDIRQIAGLWTGSDGYRFDFSQTGTQFSYRASQGTIDQGSGNGAISGDKLAYGFNAPGGTGACEAILSEDGNEITGSCHASDTPGKKWPVLIDRFVRRQIGPMRLPATIMTHRSF